MTRQELRVAALGFLAVLVIFVAMAQRFAIAETVAVCLLVLGMDALIIGIGRMVKESKGTDS